MSDLIIKGMEMPKDYKQRSVTLDRQTDDGILRLFVSDFDSEAMKYSCRVYPIVEVPTHGRLIDADQLHSLLTDMWHSNHNLSIIDVLRAVCSLPTIIEAEE